MSVDSTKLPYNDAMGGNPNVIDNDAPGLSNLDAGTLRQIADHEELNEGNRDYLRALADVIDRAVKPPVQNQRRKQDPIDIALDAWFDDGEPGGFYAERLRAKMKGTIVAYQMAGGISVVPSTEQSLCGCGEERCAYPMPDGRKCGSRTEDSRRGL